MSTEIPKKILKQLFWTFMPAFFVLSTRLPFADSIYTKLIEVTGIDPTKKESVELVFFIVGLIWLTIAWPIRLGLLESKINKERKSNVTIKRLMYCTQLADHLGVDKNKMAYSSIRFFKRKRRFLYFKGDIVFKCCQIDDLFYDEIKDDLEFTVYPKEQSQGLVGRAYIEGSCTFKDGQLDNEYQEYYDRMTDHQKTVAGDHDFVLTIAVKDKSDKVKAIISFDNKQKVGVAEKNVTTDAFLKISKIGKDVYRDFQTFL